MSKQRTIIVGLAAAAAVLALGVSRAWSESPATAPPRCRAARGGFSESGDRGDLTRQIAKFGESQLGT
jgi:hypothetical protein